MNSLDNIKFISFYLRKFQRFFLIGTKAYITTSIRMGVATNFKFEIKLAGFRLAYQVVRYFGVFSLIVQLSASENQEDEMP